MPLGISSDSTYMTFMLVPTRRLPASSVALPRGDSPAGMQSKTKAGRLRIASIDGVTKLPVSINREKAKSSAAFVLCDCCHTGAGDGCCGADAAKPNEGQTSGTNKSSGLVF